MSIGKEAGEFSFTSTGVTVSSTPNGGVSNQVNVEGTATGFGAVLGTLTFYATELGADEVSSNPPPSAEFQRVLVRALGRPLRLKKT